MLRGCHPGTHPKDIDFVGGISFEHLLINPFGRWCERSNETDLEWGFLFTFSNHFSPLWILLPLLCTLYFDQILLLPTQRLQHPILHWHELHRHRPLACGGSVCLQAWQSLSRKECNLLRSLAPILKLINKACFPRTEEQESAERFASWSGVGPSLFS